MLDTYDLIPILWHTFGAFWSRVTPPELLYIWLLSFDELRLAMNAHLPVVRPLLCYARRGATPMHQKILWHTPVQVGHVPHLPQP